MTSVKLPEKQSIDECTIISAQTGIPVSFETVLSDLNNARIIFVGERHPDKIHHKIQLKIIQELFKTHPDLSVGMEMFDHSYQPVLDLWSSGSLEQSIFIKKVHWYANWKFDFALYRDILEFIKEKNIPLIGLNIPFHIPSKIAVGGIETLSEEDRKHIPKIIDTSNIAHRTYLEEIFKQHRIKGRESFDDFYMTQCVWEDAMAESIAANLKEHTMMVVLAGNGHIIQKFGIPDRAFRRTRVPFRTIALIPQESKYDISYADYIWLTPSK